MLWLTCPNCGERPGDEFRFGGEPPPDESNNVDHVWMLDNTFGEETERWFHEAGCRRWFTIIRDTRH